MMRVLVVLAVVAPVVLCVDTYEHLCNEHFSGCDVDSGITNHQVRTFMVPCNRHQTCYSCGAPGGHSKTECDNLLRAGMESKCNKWKSDYTCYMACVSGKNKYYRHATNSAKMRYHDAHETPSYCSEPWVKACLP